MKVINLRADHESSGKRKLSPLGRLLTRYNSPPWL